MKDARTVPVNLLHTHNTFHSLDQPFVGHLFILCKISGISKEGSSSFHGSNKEVLFHDSLANFRCGVRKV
jgi:hypothetical protein